MSDYTATEVAAEGQRKKKKKLNNHEQSEEKKDRSRVERQKVDKKTKREVVGGGEKRGAGVTEKKTNEKGTKKVKKGSCMAECVEQRPPQENGQKEVERQLLRLSTTPHTKLLVSPDAEQPWFDQVCPLCTSGSAAE